MAEAHPKGVLLERAQRLGINRPEFRTERTGPEHEPSFLSDVIVDGAVLGTGQGSSKRTAEKNAAEEALASLDAREAAAPTPAAGKGKRGRGAKAATTAAATTAGDPGQAAGATTSGKANAASSGRSRSQRASGATGAAAVEPVAPADDDFAEDFDDDAPFTGPWPMFDDLLASVLSVAEKRVSLELRGEAARVAIRDFSLTLYKELLADLGEVVDEEDEDEEED